MSTSKPTAKKKSRRTGTTVIACPAARRVARIPAVIHPMLATLVNEPFSNNEWFFETKWDGFRAVCFIQTGRARVVSRTNLHMTHHDPELRDVRTSVDPRK